MSKTMSLETSPNLDYHRKLLSYCKVGLCLVYKQFNYNIIIYYNHTVAINKILESDWLIRMYIYNVFLD